MNWAERNVPPMSFFSSSALSPILREFEGEGCHGRIGFLAIRDTSKAFVEYRALMPSHLGICCVIKRTTSIDVQQAVELHTIAEIEECNTRYMLRTSCMKCYYQ
jgi:hypothetical protein